jgi:hypothetical protein
MLTTRLTARDVVMILVLVAFAAALLSGGFVLADRFPPGSAAHQTIKVVAKLSFLIPGLFIARLFSRKPTQDPERPRRQAPSA